MSDECTCEEEHEWVLESCENPDPNGPTDFWFCSKCDLPIPLELVDDGHVEYDYQDEDWYYGDCEGVE